MGNPLIDRLRDERDGLRKEIKRRDIADQKFANEMCDLKLENDRLKIELAAATFNLLPF